MSDPQFDDHLRNTLSGHRTPLDTEALWDRLSPLLAEDKKRRRGFFWWWAGAAALVLAMGLLWATGWEGERVRGREGERVRKGDVATNVASLTDSLTAEFRRVTQSNHRDKNASAYPPRNSAKLSGEKISPEFSPKLTTLDFATLGLNDYTTVRPADDTNSPLGAGGVTGGGREGERERGREGCVCQANVVETIKMRKAQLTREQQNMQIPAAIIPPQPAKKKTTFVVRPEAGMGLVFKTLQSHPGDSSDYRRARLDTEDALEYVSGTLLGGVQHSSGFYALAGLGYTRINERFYTSGSRTEYDSIPDGIVEIYIDSSGDSIITRGSVPVTRYITYRKRTYNRYTLLDVPVLLGYQWRQDRWSLGVEGGVYVNLALQSGGDILSENGDIISLQDADNVMRPRIGLSYYGSLRLGYTLGDKTQISLAPSMRVLPSFTAADYRLIQKYTLIGFNVGLTRKF
ncbi:MAG: hypothetical protein HUU34_18895 [Saprospiraceae bacterium]|nr:hypothetical protein [Saprospiraceae bacterium]